MKYQTDGSIAHAFMMRKIALKIQRSGPGCTTGKVKWPKEKKEGGHLPTCQKIIIVPSRRSVTDSDKGDLSDSNQRKKIRFILAKRAADCEGKGLHVSCWMTRTVFFSLHVKGWRQIPPALTVDCPRLRVNEVRMESGGDPEREEKKGSVTLLNPIDPH